MGINSKGIVFNFYREHIEITLIDKPTEISTEITEHDIPKNFICNLYKCVMLQHAVLEYKNNIEKYFYFGSEFPSVNNPMGDVLSENTLSGDNPMGDVLIKTIFHDIIREKIVNILLHHGKIFPTGINIINSYDAICNTLTGKFYQFKVFDAIHEIFISTTKDNLSHENLVILTSGCGSLELSNSLQILYPVLQQH